MTENTHHYYMSLALELAQRGRFSVSPNPVVGCVIVKNKKIIGQGWHQRAGEPHAEIFALQEAGSEAKEATVYLTLEPCCHYGRTPPCTSALIQAGIKEVYVACLDPNPLVSGSGIRELQSADIQVDIGMLESEAKELNDIFFHYIKNKRPYVIAKWAMSLDGKTITHPLDSRQISGMESHQQTHKIRQQVDAILVGAETVRRDNPQLTVREPFTDLPITKQPLRVILSSKGSLPSHLKLLDGNLPGNTMIATTDAIDKAWCKHAACKNVEVVILSKNKEGQVHLPHLLDQLGEREITSLLVEGGMTVLASFFNENLVNQIQVYLSPTIIGSLKRKRIISNLEYRRMGQDFYFTADY